MRGDRDYCIDSKCVFKCEMKCFWESGIIKFVNLNFFVQKKKIYSLILKEKKNLNCGWSFWY